jgi:hypothetical protein
VVLVQATAKALDSLIQTAADLHLQAQEILTITAVQVMVDIPELAVKMATW